MEKRKSSSKRQKSKIEFVDVVPFPQIGNISKRDFDLEISAGIILHGNMGTLINLRDRLEDEFGSRLVFFTLSGQPLYNVTWHDMTDKKQRQISGGKKNGKN